MTRITRRPAHGKQPLDRTTTRTYELAPAVKDDCPTLAKIHQVAYESDPAARFVWASPEKHRIGFETLLREHMFDKGVSVIKATEKSSGEIAGFAIWASMDRCTPNNQALLWPTRSDVPSSISDLIRDNFTAVQDYWLEDRNFLYLGTLVVSPTKQRQGIGSALLRQGLERADEERVPTWLQSTPVGHNVYPKFGWKDVATFELDLSIWGGKGQGWGIYTWHHMLRLPAP
ncbi:hypothetical protein MMC20_007875 [Loxospora ochrophaea]|nr:hypothetical protein [Loxospora ochrophaea]